MSEQDEADAVIAALAGGAMSPCPTCMTKTLSRDVYRSDIEHPDEIYRCEKCNINWTIFVPEGTVHRDRDSVRGMIFLDSGGNQLKWHWAAPRTRPNFVFDDTLVWFDQSNSHLSHYNFQFKRKSTGTIVTTMSTDFKLFLPLMVRGEITGKFTFRKRGSAIGVTIFKEKKPRAIRKSRARPHV